MFTKIFVHNKEATRIMEKNKQLKPTESELEILQVLWEIGPGTVREVNESLSKEKEVGYTTTLKLMQIMLEKGILHRDASAKTHIYEAAISREKTQKQSLEKLINTLFKGSSASLVMQALGNHKSSREEIEEIKKYLQELERPKK